MACTGIPPSEFLSSCTPADIHEMGLYFNGTDKMWRSDMCVHEQVVKLNHRVARATYIHRMGVVLLKKSGRCGRVDGTDVGPEKKRG